MALEGCYAHTRGAEVLRLARDALRGTPADDAALVLRCGGRILRSDMTLEDTGVVPEGGVARLTVEAHARGGVTGLESELALDQGLDELLAATSALESGLELPLLRHEEALHGGGAAEAAALRARLAASEARAGQLEAAVARLRAEGGAQEGALKAAVEAAGRSRAEATAAVAAATAAEARVRELEGELKGVRGAAA
jgi:hypothetical protein